MSVSKCCLFNFYDNIKRSWYGDYAKGWMVRGSNPGEDEIFSKRPDRLGPTQSPVQLNCVIPGGKAAGVPSWPVLG
jgi:hypothetical protein